MSTPLQDHFKADTSWIVAAEFGFPQDESGEIKPNRSLNVGSSLQVHSWLNGNGNPTCESANACYAAEGADLTSQSEREIPAGCLAQEEKCSHSEGEDENVVMEPWISRRSSSFPSLHSNHPRPFPFNRLLEELNCAQLMHNKQMELNATLHSSISISVSVPLSHKHWNKSKLWRCFAGGETLQSNTVITSHTISDLNVGEN